MKSKKHIKRIASILAFALALTSPASVFAEDTAPQESEAAGSPTLLEGWNQDTGSGKKYFVKEGVIQKGWLTCGQDKYYLDPSDGAMVTGLKKISGKQYYFTSQGKLVTAKYGYKIKNRYYQISRKGVLKKLSRTEGMAGALLDKQGKSLKKAFQWSAKIKYAPPSKTPSSKQAAKYYGEYGFRYKKGDCNVQAYTLYWLAKRMGFQSKVIHGYVPLAKGGYGRHTWVEITIKGKAYVFDPNLASQYGLDKGYKFQYGAKGTYRYHDKNKKPMA